VAEATVYVGVLLVTVDTTGAGSLKGKRAMLLPVTERLKARFPVSVARLAGLESHDWERIGVSAISNDREWLERTLGRALALVEQRGLRVRSSRLDIDVWDAE